jgi:Fe-S cluster assembly scaffold protein SufB
MTETATPSDRAVERARPARRSPADLPFAFADRTLVERLANDGGEPAWLRADRLAAFERFESLPVEANQLYTPYLDLRGADLMDAVPYGTSAAAMPSATSASVPADVAGLIELREDGVVAHALAPEAEAVGVVLETFAQALRRDPDGLRAELEGGRTLPDDKLAQLTRAAWSTGVRLVVPSGVTLERPILLRWLVGAPAHALLSRTLVSLGEGASVTLVEELLPSGPEIACAEGETVPQALFAGTTEAVLARDASLSVASIQEFGPRQIALQQRHATLGEAATVHWALGQLGGRLVRSRVDNRLEGDRSSVEQVEIVFGSGRQLFDLTSYTRHLGRDTTGNLLAKGALQDDARSFMKGLITIEKTAVGTDSFLGEFGMNLSRKSRAVAIPSLEIDQPDCRRVAHSSSVGPIDEGQVFYLESRGIPDDDARKFIVLGFLEPVVARVPLADAQQRLRDALAAKWDAGRVAAAA